MKLRYVNETMEYFIEFSRQSEHVVTITGDFPVKEKGFYLIRDRYAEIFADYSDYNTIYKNIEGGAMYSNDGSKYEEPEKDFIISASWDDENDYDGIRPDEVSVTVYKGNAVLEEITLNAENEWKKTYHDKVSALYSIQAESVEGYTMNLNDLSIVYKHEVHHQPTPSLEDRVSDVEAAVNDIIDMIIGM